MELFKSSLMKMGVMATRREFDVQLLDSFAGASYYEMDYEHEVRRRMKGRKEGRKAQPHDDMCMYVCVACVVVTRDASPYTNCGNERRLPYTNI